MKPAPFDYVRARSIRHALECLATDGAKILAGGQSLMPVMNLRMGGADLLVDIDGLTSLQQVAVTDREVVLGALIRHEEFVGSPSVAVRVPLMQAAARHIGHVAIRNRGTLGGSLAHADPSAELPAACLVLGASVVCDRADGRRRELSVDGFLEGVYQTALEEDELLTWVRIPREAADAPFGFCEVAPREGDFAEAGACAVLVGTELRVSVFSIESRARMFTTHIDAWSAELARAWAQDLSPLDEPDDRRELAAVVMTRAAQAAQNTKQEPADA